MAVRESSAEWNGSLRDGSGQMMVGGAAARKPYSFSSRFEEGAGSNPEELLAAAHAGCFSMALSGVLGKAGFTPESISTNARVHVEKSDAGFSITRIELDTRAKVPGIDADTFKASAEDAKTNCPVSRLFKGAEITLTARLEA